MTDAEKREKVIRGLEHCAASCKGAWDENNGCPYMADFIKLGADHNGRCVDLLCADALALLKEQEPRVTPRNAIAAGIGAPVWFESHNGRVYTGWALAYDIQKGMGITGECLGVTQPNGHVMWAKLDDYGRTWRMWDKCPNEEQREATAW